MKFLPVLKIVHVDPEGEVSQETHEKGLKKTLRQMIDIIPFESDADFDRRTSLRKGSYFEVKI